MYAIQTEVSDGTLVTINVGLEYFEKSEISVTLGEAIEPLTVGIDYTWTSDTTIHFPSPVANGVTVTLIRNTESNQMLNVYDGGAPFNRDSLDQNFEQLLRLAQEFREGLGLNGLNQNLDMHDYRVVNLGNPVNPKDAVNKGHLDAAIAQLVASGVGPIAAAVNVQYLNPQGGLTNLQALSSAMGYSLIGGLATRLKVWPEDFGAVGDGVADDAVAIQAWLNSLPENSAVSGKPGSKYKVVNGFDVTVKGTEIHNTHFIYPQTTFTYYHGARLQADNVRFVNNIVESPAGLVRDQTGFGIWVGAHDNVEVLGNTVMRTGSAAIWMTGATNFRVLSNKVFFPMADGIHTSDNCRNGIVACNIVQGSADDALAVVGATLAEAAPLNIVVANNVVDGTTFGHGVCLIGCDTVTVIGNILRATAHAGIGNYFWNLVGTPTDKEWANNCTIVNNTITAPGGNQTGPDNVAGIFCGASRGWYIANNRVTAPSAEVQGPASIIRIRACQDLVIENNILQGSLSYGIWNPDSNTTGAAYFTGLVIRRNLFRNIVKDAVRVNSAAGQGAVSLLWNDFYQCAYDAGTAALFTITKCAANLLVITGNVNHDTDKVGFYDPATCTNVRCSDNAPAILITFAPAPVPVSGTFTNVTATGTYHMRGRTVFYTITVTCTTKGTGTGLKVTIPRPNRALFNCSGRESALTGNALVGITNSLTQITVFTYNNGDPLTGNGAVAQISGSYESV